MSVNLLYRVDRVGKINGFSRLRNEHCFAVNRLFRFLNLSSTITPGTNAWVPKPISLSFVSYGVVYSDSSPKTFH
jgi:hypothetical protein